MNRNERGLLLVHGAAVLLVGLLLGLAAVVEELAGTQPQRWRAGHAALLLAGVWLLAIAAVLPILVLSQRQKTALCWSLLVTVYAFTIAIVVQASTGLDDDRYCERIHGHQQGPTKRGLLALRQHQNGEHRCDREEPNAGEQQGRVPGAPALRLCAREFFNDGRQPE